MVHVEYNLTLIFKLFSMLTKVIISLEKLRNGEPYSKKGNSRLIKYVKRSSCVTECLVSEEGRRCRGFWQSEKTVELSALALDNANRIQTHQLKCNAEVENGGIRGPQKSFRNYGKTWCETMKKRGGIDREKRKILGQNIAKQIKGLRDIWLKPLPVTARTAINKTASQSNHTLGGAVLNGERNNGNDTSVHTVSNGKKNVDVKEKVAHALRKRSVKETQHSNDTSIDAVLNRKKDLAVKQRAGIMLDRALIKHSKEVNRHMQLCKSQGLVTVSPEMIQPARKSFLGAMKIANSYLKAFGLLPYMLVDIKEKLMKAETDGVKFYIKEKKKPNTP